MKVFWWYFLKSQIIYSSIRVDSFKEQQSTQWWKTGTEPTSISITIRLYLFKLDIHFLLNILKKKKNPIQTLKHTYSFIHTETHENFSFWLYQHPCWEQYILLIQIYGTLSVLFPVRSGKKQFSYKQYGRYPLLYISQNLQNSQHPKYFESSGYKATLFFTLLCCVCKIAWKK